MSAKLQIAPVLLLVTAWVASLAQGPAALKPSDESELRGKIRHRAVAEVPLPRDRTSFGIGEEVEYWVEPQDGEGPDAIIAWRVAGGATVYPVVGPATVVTLGMEAGSFTVAAGRRDRVAAGAKPAPAGDLQKWARAQLAAFPKGERDPLADGLPAARDYPKELRAALYRLDGMRQGFDTSFDEVDEAGRKLLAKYPGAKERGQIYYMLAHVHAQSGLVHPERVIDYAKQALAQPLEPLQVPQLYVYWGDATQIARRNQPLAERRKWAAVVYLAGLGELLQQPLPAKAPELPGVGRGLVRDAVPRQVEEMRRLQQKQMEARRRAEFQTAMIQHRKVLTGQLAALYLRLPVAYEELRELASGVFRDPRTVEAFLRAIKGGRWPE